MKDRTQKAAALRYAVARRWFPQLELDVETMITTGSAPTVITDVDVFAAVPDELGGFRHVVIDCKTKRGESPINRVLWQCGLIERLKADAGICILRAARIEADHRYTAAQLGVTLLAESEFDLFASATASKYKHSLGAVADVLVWDAYFDAGRRFPRLNDAVRFSRSSFWLAKDEADACVRTVFLTATLRGEFDPRHAAHVALVGDMVSLFLHALARIVVNIFAAHLQPLKKQDLSSALLLFLYGGRNSYDHLNRIRRLVTDHRPAIGKADMGPAVPARSEPNEEDAGRKRRDLSLPEWDRFVDLVRQCLDAPFELAHAPLLMREIAFESLSLSDGSSDSVLPFARELASSTPQAAKFAVLGTEYLCRAAALPPEFSRMLVARLLRAQSP